MFILRDLYVGYLRRKLPKLRTVWFKSAFWGHTAVLPTYSLFVHNERIELGEDGYHCFAVCRSGEDLHADAYNRVGDIRFPSFYIGYCLRHFDWLSVGSSS